MNYVVCIVRRKRDRVELRMNIVKNDVVYDKSPYAQSRSGVEGWLLVKRGRKLGLIMFPMDVF